MLREKLDDYLDGGLSPSSAAEVESQVAADPKAARMLAAMKSERALRSAAYDTYMPTKHEAHALAERLMAEATAPVGRIGYWVRRGAAVAAGLIIVVGSFAAGQNFGPARNVYVPGETKIVYNVVYTDTSGNTAVSEFNSLKERNDFVSDLEQKGATNIVLAEYLPPGHM